MAPFRAGAAQALVNQEVAKLFANATSEVEQSLISGLSKAALWLVKPIHAKELKHMHLQTFSSKENAWIGFYFSREECEVLLQVFQSEFGLLVEMVYRDSCGVTATKIFNLEDRRTFEAYRSQILEAINIEVRKL